MDMDNVSHHTAIESGLLHLSIGVGNTPHDKFVNGLHCVCDALFETLATASYLGDVTLTSRGRLDVDVSTCYKRRSDIVRLA